MNLLPKNASWKDAFFPKPISHISDHLAVLKFLWLCNHHIRLYINYILRNYNIYVVRVCPYLNIGHNDEVHSSSLSVLSSAAIQGLRNWDYSFLSDFTQDVVLLIDLCQNNRATSNMYVSTYNYKCISYNIPNPRLLHAVHSHSTHMHGSYPYTYIVPGIICSRFAEFDHKGCPRLTDFPKLVGQTRVLAPNRTNEIKTCIIWVRMRKTIQV